MFVDLIIPTNNNWKPQMKTHELKTKTKVNQWNKKRKKGIEKGKNGLLIWNWVLKTHQLHLLFWWNESLLHLCDPQPFSSLIASYTNIKCSKFSFITNDLIINFQYHKICELQNVKLTWIIYIYDVSFLFMMFGCEICVIFVY